MPPSTVEPPAWVPLWVCVDRRATVRQGRWRTEQHVNGRWVPAGPLPAPAQQIDAAALRWVFAEVLTAELLRPECLLTRREAEIAATVLQDEARSVARHSPNTAMMLKRAADWLTTKGHSS